MPGHGRAEARTLHPQRFVERHKIRTVDRRCHRQQFRMTIDTQTRLGKLQVAEHQLHDELRGMRWWRQFDHLRRVAAVGLGGTTQWIAQGSRPADRARLAIGADRRTSQGIHGRPAGDRQARNQIGHIGFDVR